MSKSAATKPHAPGSEFIGRIRWIIALALIYVFLVISKLFLADIVATLQAPSIILLASFLTCITALTPAFAYLYRRYRDAWTTLVARWSLHLTRWRLTVSVSSSIVIAVLALAIAQSSHQLYHRAWYLVLLNRTVTALTYENVEHIKPAGLAAAFALYPARREVPFLIVRVGRVLSHAGNWPAFVRFQKAFVTALLARVNFKDLCKIQYTGHDPAAFIAIAYLEGSIRVEDNRIPPSPANLTAGTESLRLLQKCPATAARSVVAMRLKAFINSKDPHNPKYDIGEKLTDIRRQIDILSPGARTAFSTTHTYQEYLDFEANLAISQLYQASTVDYSQENQPDRDKLMDLVIENYRNLLSLRTALGAPGTIRWYTTPEKLNLYHYFIGLGGSGSDKNRGFVKRLNAVKTLASRLKKLADSPAFRKFQTRTEWFRATPLDNSLEGAALRRRFRQWTKEGW